MSRASPRRRRSPCAPPPASRRRGSRRRRRRGRDLPESTRPACRAAARSSRQLEERRGERVAYRNGERVGRVVRRRQLVQPEDRLHHPLHLRFLRPAVAGHRVLHRRGRVLGAGHAGLGGRDEHGAARLSDGERGAGVDADEGLLEDDRIRVELGDEPGHAVVDRLQAELGALAGGRRPPAVVEALEAPSAFVDDPVPASSRSWVASDDSHGERLGTGSDDPPTRSGYPATASRTRSGMSKLAKTSWTSSLSSSCSMSRSTFFASPSSATSTVVFGTIVSSAASTVNPAAWTASRTAASWSGALVTS